MDRQTLATAETFEDGIQEIHVHWEVSGKYLQISNFIDFFWDHGNKTGFDPRVFLDDHIDMQTIQRIEIHSGSQQLAENDACVVHRRNEGLRPSVDREGLQHSLDRRTSRQSVRQTTCVGQLNKSVEHNKRPLLTKPLFIDAKGSQLENVNLRFG